MNNPKRINTLVLLISLALFIVSLGLPAYYTEGSSPDDWANSFGLLLIGWLGILFAVPAALCWLANPLILIAWITSFKRPKTTLILSGLAAFFVLTFLFFDEILVNE